MAAVASNEYRHWFISASISYLRYVGLYYKIRRDTNLSFGAIAVFGYIDEY